MQDGTLDLRRRRDVASLFEHDAVDMPPSLFDRARTVAHEVFQIGEHGGPLRIGQRVDAYEVEGVLGAGGQAFVYEAKQAATGRRVALKVPRDDVGARLLREAELTARIDSHPHVVSVYAAGEVDAGVPYLAMELLTGGTLEERIEAAPGGLPLAEVRRVGGAILEALEHAHAQGVLHRDLKPSNVLFDAQGQPKLADLGIGADASTQSLEHSVDLTGLTGNQGLGTPSYSAPEQVNPALRGGEPLDARADLYGFGKLLYAMLTGANPATIKPVSRVRPELDPAWDELVFALVEDDRQRRPLSANEVRAAFDGLPGSGGPAAGPGHALRRELALRTADAPEGSSDAERMREFVGEGARPTRLLGFAAALSLVQAVVLALYALAVSNGKLPRVVHSDPLSWLAIGAFISFVGLLDFRKTARRTPGRPGRGLALLVAFPVSLFPAGLALARANGGFPHLTQHGFTELAAGASAAALAWLACWCFGWRIGARRTPNPLAPASVEPARPRGPWGVIARVTLGILSFLSAAAAFVMALIVVALGTMMRGCAEAVGGTTSGGLSTTEEAALLYILPLGLVLLGLLAFGSLLFRRPPAE